MEDRLSLHIPVLLHEVIYYLDLQPGAFIIDGTVDGGGHADAILKKISPRGKILGIDWDRNMIEKTKDRFRAHTNVLLVSGNYAELPKILENQELGKAQGLLLDLGFSSEQLQSGKGFSFEKDEPLTMTYAADEIPVYKLLKTLREEELADIIFQFGGERMSRRIAKAIKLEGRKKSIATTRQLAEIVRGVLPKNYERGRIDPATRTFQALRIYANHELENLESICRNLPEILVPGGRAVIISFHSLEDRIVKNCFREMEKKHQISILTKKPITPSVEELRFNSRSRSAKLRAAVIS